MSDATSADRHWDNVYGRVGPESVSWYQSEAATSMALIEAAGQVRSVVDVGAGASVLVDSLLDAGIGDVTLVDISDVGLRVARERLGARAGIPRWWVGDVRAFAPHRRFDLWHDRALFHFLTEPADRAAYRSTLARTLHHNGHAIIGSFAADGPTHCSGLPVMQYAPQALADEFPDFRIVVSRRVEHVTPSGAVQPFTWLLLAAFGGSDSPSWQVGRIS